MSLSTLAGGLLTEAGALVLNCCCVVIDIVCDNKPCLRDWDCKYFPDCICIDGRCEDAIRDSCPPGYTEIPLPDGKVKCEPNCTGDPCQATADCAEGCACVGGRCIPTSDAFFCIDGECQRGGDLVYDPTDPDRPKGPYPTYQACCMAIDENGEMCGCGFACLSDCQCIPSEDQQDYESYQECRANCCDPDDAGRCCYNELIKNSFGDVISLEWHDCADSLSEDCKDGPIEPTAGGGTRQITSSFTKGVDCDPSFKPPFDNMPSGEGCPIPEFGACCIIDVLGDVVDCIEETKVVCDDMPNRPGDFPQYPPGFTTESKSFAWLDCENRRNPILNEDFACDNCNGNGDCACAVTERCTGQECVICYDDDPSKRGDMVRAQAGVDRQIGSVTNGETVTFYIRDCVSDATGAQTPVTDRRAIIKINGTCGDSLEQEITDEGQIQVTYSGEMYLTGVAGIPDVQVCLTLERDVATVPDCDSCSYDDVAEQDVQGDSEWSQNASVIPIEGIIEWNTADGWPNCVGQNDLVMVLSQRTSSKQELGVIYSNEEVRKLYLCDNGTYTDVTDIAVALWESAGFADGCVGGGLIPIAAGQSKKHVTYTYDTTLCISSDQWNAYGNLIDVDLPDPDRWNCPQSRLLNPLP